MMEDFMRAFPKSGAVVALLLVVSGCTTTGTGTGLTRRGEMRASFAWTAQGPTRGEMTATLANGAIYRGRFFQITQDTVATDLGPLWTGWRGRNRWRGWGYWGPDSETITHYSGQVLANLQGPDGFMRCRFTLVQPSSGMQQGGQGDCQMPQGGRIQAMFDRAH
jgi:hypothetical protein